jgi:phosphate transport system substrate-binding protein
MKRKLISLLLAVMMATAMFPALSASAADPLSISIEIDGKIVTPTVAPILTEGGTTLVQGRFFTEYLGADVSWNQPNQEMTIKTAGYTVVFKMASRAYTVNGVAYQIPAAYDPPVNTGSAMVPMRFLFESIGSAVSYDTATKTAKVSYFTGLTGSIKVSGSTTVLPIMQSAADKLMGQNGGLSVTVAGGGSGAGIKDTQSGANNVGMSSRDLTADEMAEITPVKMANDAIAIIVNPKNPVTSLTTEQAAKIFLGEITNWTEVGGNDATIKVQTRETGSGTLATLEEMLLDRKTVVEKSIPFTSSALIKQAVANDEDAIGFDSIGFVDSTVRAVSLNGIDASDATVKNATYPLSRSLYVMTKGTAAGINARLIDYLRSAIVQQEIVQKEGYITL